MAERVLQFIGVTTGASAIVKIFPAWADYLGLDGAELEGVDIAVAAEPELYRDAVQAIRDDPRVAGALVTTHKLDLLEAASDLFDVRDEFARLCGECSCIYKLGDQLVAGAKDPITAGRTMDEMVPGDWFSEAGGDVLCLGAGGAGIAITLHLLTRMDRPPGRVTVVDIDQRRLDHMRELHSHLAGEVEVEYVLGGEPAANDAMVELLPPGSLVINATGMGKDRPGSPVTDGVRFPGQAIVWEINYRGDLRFLESARSQAEARGLHVYDGWRYFVHGWTAVIEEVFALRLTGEDIDRLSEIALRIRSEASA